MTSGRLWWFGCLFFSRNSWCSKCRKWEQVCWINSDAANIQLMWLESSVLHRYNSRATVIITTWPFDSNSWNPLSILLLVSFSSAASGSHLASYDLTTLQMGHCRKSFVLRGNEIKPQTDSWKIWFFTNPSCKEIRLLVFELTPIKYNHMIITPLLKVSSYRKAPTPAFHSVSLVFCHLQLKRFLFCFFYFINMNISNRMSHSAAECASSRGTSFLASLLAHRRRAETPQRRFWGCASGIPYACVWLCPSLGVWACLCVCVSLCAIWAVPAPSAPLCTHTYTHTGEW